MTNDEALAKSVAMFREATPASAEAPISEWRDGFEAMAAQFELLDGLVVEKVDIAGVPGLKVTAPGALPERLIVHYHSGGYVMGSAHSYRSFAGRLSAATRAAVIVPDYRLAPENAYPAASEDGIAVYKACVESHGAGNILLSGDSAGGGLCIATLLAARDRGIPLPVGAIAISPLLDLAGEGDSANIPSDPLINRDLIVGMGKVYIGEADPHDLPLASPLWGTHHGLPPLFLIASKSEALRDDVVRLAASVESAGGKVQVSLPDGLVHIWTIFPFLDASKQSLSEIGTFAEACFSGS